MNDIVIEVEDLGKLHRIGQIVGYRTLREGLTNAVAAPFRGSRSEIETLQLKVNGISRMLQGLIRSVKAKSHKNQSPITSHQSPITNH